MGNKKNNNKLTRASENDRKPFVTFEQNNV